LALNLFHIKSDEEWNDAKLNAGFAVTNVLTICRKREVTQTKRCYPSNRW